MRASVFRHPRIVATGLGLLLGIILAGGQQVDAHHGDLGIFQHWGDGYRPAVSAPNSFLWPYTSHAEGTWVQAGFQNGFCVAGAWPLGELEVWRLEGWRNHRLLCQKGQCRPREREWQHSPTHNVESL